MSLRELHDVQMTGKISSSYLLHCESEWSDAKNFAIA